MTDTWKSFVLPENFKAAEDGSLRDFLRMNAGAAVRIDVGGLRRLDTVLIELLLCAAQDWRKAGKGFEVANLTGVNAEVVATLGLTPDHFAGRAAA